MRSKLIQLGSAISLIAVFILFARSRQSAPAPTPALPLTSASTPVAFPYSIVEEVSTAPTASTPFTGTTTTIRPAVKSPDPNCNGKGASLFKETWQSDRIRYPVNCIPISTQLKILDRPVASIPNPAGTAVRSQRKVDLQVQLPDGSTGFVFWRDTTLPRERNPS